MGKKTRMGDHRRIVAIFMLMLVNVSGPTAIRTGTNSDWSQKLLDSIQARDSIIPKITTFINEVTPESINNAIASLDAIYHPLQDLENLNLTASQGKEQATKVKKLQEDSLVKKWFQSQTLESAYTTKGLGLILKTMKTSLSSSPGSFTGKDLPLSQMCAHVQGQKNEYATDKICRNIKMCSGNENPNPYDASGGNNVQEACEEETNACKVTVAVRMMGALLWYKVSDFIALGFCYNYLSTSSSSELKPVIHAEREDVYRMTSLISAYISTLNNWREFFDKAASQRAFSNLAPAMKLVEEREKSFKWASLACDKLEADDMCTVGDIFGYYESLKKIKKDRKTPPQTRNLRYHSRVDHAKMLELKRNALQHINLLGNIQQLDHNVGTLAEGMSGYMFGLAKYDEGIANQDEAFLSGKLKEFETKSSRLSKKVQQDTKDIMIAANVALSAQLVEEIAILAAKIANHVNPLKVIFTGVELADIYEQTGEVARAVQELAHGVALFATFHKVYEDMYKLADSFKNNTEQIAGLQKLIESIKKKGEEDVDYDSQRFIEAYGSYTPRVGKKDLARNDALWSAYKDSTCDLLFGAQGIGAGVTQTVTGGMLLCEKLEGSLAEFFALRENVFDFQFDLVDAFAGIVRGNIAKKLSKSIKIKNDRLKAGMLLLGFFMTQFRLQFEAAVYCDKWEYMNQGKRIAPCEYEDFMDESRLDDLLTYDFGTLYHEDERFVYLPTKPQFPGDTGYINLPSLRKGNSVLFRIPANRTWLRQFNWFSSEEVLAPFVASFKLYLPHKTYPTEGRAPYSKTSVKLTSTAGSRLDDTSGVVYNLPLEHCTYMTTYEEGYDPTRCQQGKEIVNPYSLCDNLPLICDTMTRVPGSLIMPTILSTWKLTYSSEKGQVSLPWDAPRPATDLLFIAKVKLRFLPNSLKKRRAIDNGGEFVYGCCAEGNTYRPKWNNRQCIPCPTKPTKSTSRLQGYYCEKGNDAMGQKIPKNLYTIPTTTPTTVPTRPA